MRIYSGRLLRSVAVLTSLPRLPRSTGVWYGLGTVGCFLQSIVPHIGLGATRGPERARRRRQDAAAAQTGGRS